MLRRRCREARPIDHCGVSRLSKCFVAIYRLPDTIRCVSERTAPGPQHRSCRANKHLLLSSLRVPFEARHSSRRLGDVVSTDYITLSNLSGIGSGNTIERLDLRLRRVSFGVEPSPFACCPILNRESRDLKRKWVKPYVIPLRFHVKSTSE